MLAECYVYGCLILFAVAAIAVGVMNAKELDDWEDAYDQANREYLTRREYLRRCNQSNDKAPTA